MEDKLKGSRYQRAKGAWLVAVGWGMFGFIGGMVAAENPVMETGLRGGMVVHLGCGDGAFTVALGVDERTVVQGLDTDVGRVEEARETIREAGRYGVISAHGYDGEHLPYIDDLINLVVCDESVTVPMDEIMRVLAPLGAVWVKRKGEWEVTQKPWPAEMDEWNQYLRGADNNAVSRDERVGPPRHLRWVTDPAWSRSHMTISTVNSMVTARGRLFTIEDKATSENPFLPGRFSLVGRDAFNGTVLWEHAFADWEPVTRYIKDLLPQLQRRLVAVEDRVYCTPALEAPLTAFDAKTGEVLKAYEGTERTQEFAYHEGVLYAVIGDPMWSPKYDIVKSYGGKGVSGGGTDPEAPFDGTGFPEGYSRETRKLGETRSAIVALDAETGEELWAERGIPNYIGASLALQGDYAAYMSQGGVKCLDARTGEVRWEVEKDSEPVDGVYASTLVISGRVLYAEDHGVLTAYSLEHGHEKWKSKAKLNYQKAADLFVVGGVPWTGGSGAPTSHDPETGMEDVVIKQQMMGPMGHDRCYRNFITENYFINSKTGGADFVDLRTKQEYPNHWLRGTCGMGVVPANGTLYVPPYSCQCSMGSMITNFNAVYAEKGLVTPEQVIEVPRAVQLVKGPAYGEGAGPAAGPGDWSTYRHDGTRSGVSEAPLPAALHEEWSVEFSGTPSAPVIAAGKVFVSDVDAHTVHALDVETGEKLWAHTAGGRVDTPPTYYEGLILFGSRDGWVSCLRASDGELVWRFKDLPDKLLGAFGQVESAWPVNGSILVENGVAYFGAGRSSFLDGGIFVYGLDPVSGEVIHRQHTYGPFDETNGFPKTTGKSDSGSDNGFKGDLMVSDGKLVYMRHMAFHTDLSPSEESFPHLIPSAGFLDGAPQHRTYWTVGSSYAWTGVKGADCDILVTDGARFYGVQGFRTHRHSYFDPRKDGYQLMSGKLSATVDRRGEAAGEVAGDGKKGKKKGKKAKKDGGGEDEAGLEGWWSVGIGLTGKAMVKAGEQLVVAGTPMAFEEGDYRAFEDSYEGRSGGVLAVVSAVDGEAVAEYELEAAPAWDGMAVAGGRLFISLKDGTLRCWGGR